MLRIAQSDSREIGGVHADDGQISRRIVTDRGGREAARVGQGDFNAGGSVDDVTVSQDESVRRDNKTRSVAAELVRSTREAHALFYVDVHNGGGDTRDCTDHGARIRVEQGVIGWRDRLGA